jgi:hypothetical protein
MRTIAEYDRVLRALMPKLPALLPVRFGTRVADPSGIVQLIRQQEPALRAGLRHVRNRVQMTVAFGSAVKGASPAPVSHARTHTSGARKRGPGTRYLHARAEAAARERELPGFEPVRAAVARWLRDERVEKRARAGTTLVHHLVPAGAAAAYRRAVARASAAAGLDTAVTGPLPPYAFARGGLE